MAHLPQAQLLLSLYSSKLWTLPLFSLLTHWARACGLLVREGGKLASGELHALILALCELIPQAQEEGAVPDIPDIPEHMRTMQVGAGRGLQHTLVYRSYLVKRSVCVPHYSFSPLP